MTLRRRASKLFPMNEGRKSQIVLLDERRLDIIIQPKLYSNELLDLVASHFKLKEKQYFGLGFLDETNHFNWLQGEKRVLDHEFPKKTGLLVLHFGIKFYVDTIGLLRDIQTVELFYLNARQLLFRGHLECDTETVFELAAHVLQATNGDFVSEEETREELKKLPVIPTSALKEHPSIAFCENRVIHFYEKINGTSRGLAIVNYMTIVEKISTYGIHYYDVKDKKDIPWWLGISPKGIAVYDKNDKTTPRKLFTWKNLENLYYRDRKFSIEVHGPKRIIHTRSSFNTYQDVVRESPDKYDDLSTAITEPTTQVSVSRRTFGASNVDVHAWFASTPQLTKCIWSMAVVQHQFYLDRKQSRGLLTAARSMSEIAADLCRSTTSLPGSLGSDLSRSPSSHSLPSLSNSRYDLTIEQSDSLKAERDMYQALKSRKEALEDSLRKKTEELKLLCLQEGELIGELPHDFPLGPGEQPPVFRRRVGTAFSLSVKSGQDADQLSTELSKLELEVELQGKITAAAHKLASDKTVSKYVRKQRRLSYTKAFGKLKDMEKKLDEMRKLMRKPTSSDHQAGNRSLDGMYHVLHPNSKCDFDFEKSVGVHELTANTSEDSNSGGRIISANIFKNTSFEDFNSITKSPSICRSYPNTTDGFSSSSDSLSSSNTSRDTGCMNSQLLYVKDTIDKTQTSTENISLNTSDNRKQNFDIISSKYNNCINFGLEEPNPTQDIDSTFDNSKLVNDISCSTESDFKNEDKKFNTKVERRGKTFIACKRMKNNFHINKSQRNRYVDGWKEFEQILMGEDKNETATSKQYINNSMTQHGKVVPSYIRSKIASSKYGTSPSQKSRRLSDKDDNRQAVRRSRSFDSKHDLLVTEKLSDENNLIRDDLKLIKCLPDSKDSTLKRRKPFLFIASKQNNIQMRHFHSEVKSSSSNISPTILPAQNLDISVKKGHMDQIT